MNKYTFEQLQIGMQADFTVKITSDAMMKFCQLTGDINPLHCDKTYALQQGFKDKVVYGMLTSSFLSTLVGIYLPGKKSLIQNVEINFVKPVYIDEKLTIKGEVVDKNELFRVANIRIAILNSRNEKVVRGKMMVGVLE